jgi:ATP-dependent metalloprotease
VTLRLVCRASGVGTDSLLAASVFFTCCRQGGHALVAILTEGATPVYKATIMPRGQALGMVTQLPDKDEVHMTFQQMLARLDVCMGGRVAEEVRRGLL